MVDAKHTCKMSGEAIWGFNSSGGESNMTIKIFAGQFAMLNQWAPS